MIKNKTHRIISISPSSQHSSSIKNVNNKTVTPIKPIQHPTRTNTIKTNGRPQDSVILDETHKKQQNNHNAIQSVLVSSYKQEAMQHTKKDMYSIDQILNRIGKDYDSQKNSNASIQLYKKSQVNQLRQVIRQAKHLIKYKKQIHYDHSSINQKKQFLKIPAECLSLRQQISNIFQSLHKQLQIKQKKLYEQLDLKIFQLKDKVTVQEYQVQNLKNYLQKCEKDVNNNYQGIIQQLSIQQLNKIVNSYVNKIQFYMDMVKTNFTIKLDIPNYFQQIEWIKDFRISIDNENPEILKQIECENNGNIDSKVQKIQDRKYSFDKKKQKRKMDGHLKNVKSAFDEMQNLSINKILMKKIQKQDEYQPRISSARGRY